jgi:hypothetical protein
MAQDAKDFDFGTADLETFLKDVTGLNIIYRNKMLAALKSEDDEMSRLWEIFEEINTLEVDKGIRHMTPEFRQGFVTLYIMNGGRIK